MIDLNPLKYPVRTAEGWQILEVTYRLQIEPGEEFLSGKACIDSCESYNTRMGYTVHDLRLVDNLIQGLVEVEIDRRMEKLIREN